MAEYESQRELEATAPRFPAAPSAETPVVAAIHVTAPAPNSALRDNGFGVKAGLLGQGPVDLL